MTSLTRELKKPDSPIARHLLDRFPNVRDLQRRYAQATAELAPIEPRPGVSIAYSTLGTAFDWQARFLVDPAPDLHLAFAGARLMAEVGGTLTQATRPGPLPPRWTAPADGRRVGALDAERLARVCWALALFTEVYRSGLAPGSPLDLLAPTAGLDELLALADEEIADLLALTATAKRVLVPALAERGGPVHVGPTFAGSADIAADADLIASGLLLECKVNLGDRRDGRRRCSLARLTIHELLGYLLLATTTPTGSRRSASTRPATLTWPPGRWRSCSARSLVARSTWPGRERSSARSCWPRPTRSATCEQACRRSGRGPPDEPAGGARVDRPGAAGRRRRA